MERGSAWLLQVSWHGETDAGRGGARRGDREHESGQHGRDHMVRIAAPPCETTGTASAYDRHEADRTIEPGHLASTRV